MRTLCLALALSGCSIIGTKSVAEHGAAKCSTTAFPPAVDTAAVAGAIASATYATLEMEDIDHIAIPVAAGVGLIYGISAIVGYSRVTSCKRARIKEGIAY
jgi:hypothetical protein